MLRDRRKIVHKDIVTAFETEFAERIKTDPELVAYHCERVDEPDFYAKAANYWYKAGQNAVERSANHEAIRHLQRGIRASGRLSDLQRFGNLELRMQLTMGHACIATRGYCDPLTKQAFLRAAALAVFADRPEQRAGILFGEYVSSLMCGKLD